MNEAHAKWRSIGHKASYMAWLLLHVILTIECSFMIYFVPLSAQYDEYETMLLAQTPEGRLSLTLGALWSGLVITLVLSLLSYGFSRGIKRDIEEAPDYKPQRALQMVFFVFANLIFNLIIACVLYYFHGHPLDFS